MLLLYVQPTYYDTTPCISFLQPTCATISSGSAYPCSAGTFRKTIYASITPQSIGYAQAACCEACPYGSYQDAAGATACKTCSVSGMVPNTAATACVCPVGYAYTPASASVAATCVACSGANQYQDVLSTGSATPCKTGCAAPKVINALHTACVCGGNFQTLGSSCGKCQTLIPQVIQPLATVSDVLDACDA